MGQAASHNHHAGQSQHGDRPRSIGGSGVNFGSGPVPHGVHNETLKDGSPFDGQVKLRFGLVLAKLLSREEIIRVLLIGSTINTVTF